MNIKWSFTSAKDSIHHRCDPDWRQAMATRPQSCHHWGPGTGGAASSRWSRADMDGRGLYHCRWKPAPANAGNTGREHRRVHWTWSWRGRQAVNSEWPPVLTLEDAPASSGSFEALLHTASKAFAGMGKEGRGRGRSVWSSGRVSVQRYSEETKRRREIGKPVALGLGDNSSWKSH